MEQVTSELENLLLGPENEVDEFLLKGEISQAAQLSLSVLASAKVKTECGQNVPTDIQFHVRKVNKCSKASRNFLSIVSVPIKTLAFRFMRHKKKECLVAGGSCWLHTRSQASFSSKHSIQVLSRSVENMTSHFSTKYIA